MRDGGTAMTDEGRRPSVLVGMLHVGEPSVERVRERLRAQVDVDVELFEVAHLPEREAHARLYGILDAAGPAHDALVKVDADMELVEPRLLHAIGMLLRHHPELDHLVLGVDDWFSGRRIIGMNAWRRGIRWTSPPPELFTDLPSNTARTKLKLMDVGRPLVLHAADPDDAQAVRYGLHRGLKAVATGKASRIGRLHEVVNHAEAMPARGRRLAVAAIGLALTDGGGARALLDASGGADPDLSAAIARIADPTLCVDVRGRITRLAAEARPDVISPRRGPFPSMLETVRSRIARAVRRAGQESTAVQDAHHAEFLALLDGPQPSRSSA